MPGRGGHSRPSLTLGAPPPSTRVFPLPPPAGQGSPSRRRPELACFGQSSGVSPFVSNCPSTRTTAAPSGPGCCRRERGDQDTSLAPVVGGQGLPLVPAAAPSCDHPLPSSSSTRRPREPTPPPVSEPAKCWEEDLGRALAQALKEQGGWAGRHTFQGLSLLISKMRTVDDSPPRPLPALGEPHSRPINMFVCVSSQATH